MQIFRENGINVTGIEISKTTKEAPNFSKDKLISKDRYEFHECAKIFYYDKETVQTEFGKVGLFEIIDLN